MPAKNEIEATAMARTVATLMIASYGLVLYMITELRKTTCPCVKDDWRDEFCFYFSILGVVMHFITLVMGHKKWMQRASYVVGILSMANMIVLATYLHRLKTPECGCEHHEYQTFVRLITYLWVAVLGINLIYAMYFALGMTLNGRK